MSVVEFRMPLHDLADTVPEALVKLYEPRGPLQPDRPWYLCRVCGSWVQRGTPHQHR